jgi:hypothetical protein
MATGHYWIATWQTPPPQATTINFNIRIWQTGTNEPGTWTPDIAYNPVALPATSARVTTAAAGTTIRIQAQFVAPNGQKSDWTTSDAVAY